MINLCVMMASQKSFMESFGKKLKPHFRFNTKILFNRRTKHFTKTSSNEANWKKYGDKRFIKNGVLSPY